ncbi:MAG: hypothetical protein JO235_18250 [Chroococcidiopsidaceae cyanobacterium CP_BM_RX_35]|nr:hypothetical protein [Chroococcidiopsidaceae cyanobacterium CP_BM_RX_35]
MSFFNSSEPLLRDKQQELDFQDLQGLWRFKCKIGNITLFSGFYSRIDQTFVLWGLISSSIFVTAQFLPISWITQAILWSILTLVGTVSMVVLTWFWVSVERLRWVVYCWVLLMLVGLILTDLGIFLDWGEVLMRLCPLWLGLSALGYICTGLGMRSRTFVFVGVVHLLSVVILPYVSAWCFLATGAIMAVSLLLLAEWQWEMRPPIDYAHLTAEQKQFNQKQYQLRQQAS